jgi:hypothetical protein
MNVRRSGLSAVAVVVMLAAAPAWAGNGQNLLQYVPQNAAIVVNVDLEQLRSLPLYQMIWGVITANPDAQRALTEMQTQAGFNPNTDLSGFLIALSPEDSERWSVLVEGNFNVEQITAYLGTQMGDSDGDGQPDMAAQQYAGHTVYYDPTESESDRGYFTFLNNNIVAAGTQQELSGVLDTVGGTVPSVTSQAQMSNLLSSVDTSGTFWFAGTLSPAMQAQMVGSPMEGVSTMRGSGNFTGGLNIDYVLGTNTPEQAATLAAFINDQIAQARTAPEIQQMGLGSMLDTVNVSANETSVGITAAIPEQTMNQIIGIMSALLAAQAGHGMTPPPQ